MRRLRRRIKYGRHTRRVRRIVLWSVGGLLLLGAVWLLVTGLLARRQLEQLHTQVDSVRQLVATGHIPAARSAAAGIPATSRRAHEYTTGPAWWTAAHIPYLGRPVAIARGTTSAAADLGTGAIPTLVDVSTQIDPDRLRTSGDTVRLAPLTAAAPRLVSASRSLHRALVTMRGLPHSSWLPQIDRQRTSFEAQVRTVDGYVGAATRVARTLPAMLGANGTRRYFIALQNEAEPRGTGGLPGAFAIVTARNGRIHFTHFESDTALAGPTGQGVATGLRFGRAYDNLYGVSLATSQFNDSNASPQFPYAAQIWAAMWQRVSGEHVDGALVVDPTALAAFLGATGPTTLPSGATIAASNVVTLTERDQYALFPNLNQRKAFLVSVLKATADKVTSGAGGGIALLNAASASSKQRRLLVWSRSSRVERALAQTNFAGILPAAGRPLAAPVLNNATGGKLGYYLTRSLDYTRTGCGASRDVIATIRIRNDAPASGLPAYVTTRLDSPPPGARPGDDRELLDYYATGGAVLSSVEVDGRPATAAPLTDGAGHAVFRMDVELPRGTTTTIVLHLDEPAGHGAPVILRQPGVTPLAVQENNQTCGV